MNTHVRPRWAARCIPNSIQILRWNNFLLLAALLSTSKFTDAARSPHRKEFCAQDKHHYLTFTPHATFSLVLANEVRSILSLSHAPNNSILQILLSVIFTTKRYLFISIFGSCLFRSRTQCPSCFSQIDSFQYTNSAMYWKG